MKVATEEPVPPSHLKHGVPFDLETICLKCLQKEPGRRYGSADELAADLERYRNGEPIRARPVGSVERLLKWGKRKPAAAGLVAAALILVVVVCALLGIVWSQLHETQNALEARDREQQDRQKAERERAIARVNALRDAAPGAVPGLLAELEATREDVLPQLRELSAQADEANTTQRMRIALALLPVEPDLVREDLGSWLLQTDDPADVLLFRDVLAPYSAELCARYWKTAEDEAASPDTRFRALVALAAFDPGNNAGPNRPERQWPS